MFNHPDHQHRADTTTGQFSAAQGTPAHPEAITRGTGVTPAERYLARLCDGTFLSVWSHSGLYRGVGKELTDLLVVFENDVILFSDKHCAFPDTGDIDIDWARWFRTSVQKSADQLYGAERWLRASPDRVYLDPGCKHSFPFPIPRGDT